jgi:hypothetical protein
MDFAPVWRISTDLKLEQGRELHLIYSDVSQQAFSTADPGGDSLGAESAHILQTSATHGEVAD